MKDFYVVAKKDLEPNLPHSADWPKIIAYSYKTKSFLLIEGKGHGFNGTVLPDQIAREPRWNQLFLDLNALWFLSFIDSTTYSSTSDFEKILKVKTGFIDVISS
ncbi:hypothetical protein PUP68_02270 [Pseudomonas chlororaphis]|uniref:hypothetical protein n=1 Tax=Pseudomonas chlororaphis TaxID=587753 RepID=UPI001B32081C|nr:hypothetical protein [Pseudomonas chlororaphis]MBP5074224.1 hypothetical protein [Pseudomonas chlororaphis]WDG81003.1 hypothetical protein PUP77_09970 [Pseudomonas chlororaphis]WDG85944.1 hypothetical protein PUP68_02270 [Pseudomonas chlororaphis]